MKNLLLLLLIFLNTDLIQAQDNKDIFKELTEAFLQNNAQNIGNNLANSIDLSIEDTDGTFGKPQAIVIIKDFLAKNKVTSFKIKHQGSSNDLTKYAVSEMTGEQKIWSVYILINKESQIIQLQIDSE